MSNKKIVKLVSKQKPKVNTVQTVKAARAVLRSIRDSGKVLQEQHAKGVESVHEGTEDYANHVIELGMCVKSMGNIAIILANYIEAAQNEKG